jgi:hypothetical protein
MLLSSPQKNEEVNEIKLNYHHKLLIENISIRFCKADGNCKRHNLNLSIFIESL